MRILRVSSVPTGLFVTDFFVLASVPSALLGGHCCKHVGQKEKGEAQKRAGAESEVAHLWARWLRNPCRLGGSPPLQSGGQNQKWPTCGQGGCITPAASGIPTASERGAESEVAHLWARWLRNPCRLGDPRPFRAVFLPPALKRRGSPRW